jgi:hypothetical protein
MSSHLIARLHNADDVLPCASSERRLNGGAYGLRLSKAVDGGRAPIDATAGDEPKEAVRATLPPLPANASPRLTVAYRALQKAYRSKDGYLKGSSDRQLADAATRYSALRVTPDTIRRLLGKKK